MSKPVISIENLSKAYQLGVIGTGTFKGDMQRWWAKFRGLPDPYLKIGEVDYGNRQGETLWALKDINFQVQQGEALGIIGRNGAGKSTLLKILSRVTSPTNGLIKTKGRIASLLEVGTGFHPELTGRENIFLNGAIMGMSRTEVTRKFDGIVDFSGVEKFIDTPVKRYSSGMYVRLAFAVAAHLEPEILIVDEVLAVGDAEFQKKCLGKMGDITQEGRTVLFVSHNMAAIENLCKLGILLDHGKVGFIGSQSEAISAYQRSSHKNSEMLRDRKDHHGSGEIRVTGIEFRDSEGHTIDNITSGQDFDIVFNYEAKPGFQNNRVVASFVINTQWDMPVSLNHNRMTGDQFGKLPEKGSFVCRINRINLTSSVYRLTYNISVDTKIIDSIIDAIELNIVAGDYFGTGEIPPSSHGFCILDGRWRLEK